MWQLVASIDYIHSGLVVSASFLLVMFVFQPLVKNAILMSTSIRSVSHALVICLLLAHDGDHCVADAGAIAQPPRRHCDRCADRRGGGEHRQDDGARLSRHDVAAVMECLGLVAAGELEDDEDDEHALCGGCEAMAAVEELTERKVAGEGELREAFYVFDRDEDGYVTAAELWSVLRRLGMEEGTRYGDCVRMVAARDGDGDGRISFREFRAMMEHAV